MILFIICKHSAVIHITVSVITAGWV